MIKTRSFSLATYSRGSEATEKLALVLPGRLDTKDYPSMRSHVDYLANRGYYAASFDPPGTWESEGDISLYSMTTYKQAIDELIEILGNKPTLLIGHSRGGSIVMLAGPKNPYVVAGIMVMSHPSFVPVEGDKPDLEWKERGFKLNRRDIPGSEEFKEYQLPYSFVEDQEQYDMREDLKKWRVPKLFVYGERDVTVKPEVVREAYQLAVEPKELASIPWDHDYRQSQEMITKVNKLAGNFLNKYEL